MAGPQYIRDSPGNLGDSRDQTATEAQLAALPERAAADPADPLRDRLHRHG
jgi:hypothetical protein